MISVAGAGASADGIGDLPEFRTGDPIVGPTLALRRDPLTALVEPYRRFGRIFRTRLLGRRVVVIAGLDANEFAWRDAGQWTWAASRPVLGDHFVNRGLADLDPAIHRAKRNLLGAAFRPRPVERQLAAMAVAWRAAIRARDGAIVDLRDLCRAAAFHATAVALLGTGLPAGGEDDIGRLEGHLAGGTAPISPRARVRSILPARRARARALSGALTDIARIRRRDWSGEDLLSEIMHGLSHGARIPSVEELVHDSVVLLRSAVEPAAQQILWTVLLLQSRPDWWCELRSELDGWSPDDAPGLARLPLLRATVLEAERLRPVVPFSLRVAARDLTFAERRMPEGSTVLHASTLAHFLDEVYGEPTAFRPERFCDPEVDPAPLVHGTYGGGSHACLGQPLGRAHIAVAVACFTTEADLVPFSPVSLRPHLDGLSTPVEHTLPVRVARRPGR